MVQLSISAACSYVRKMLDELVSVEEIGMIASPDGIDLHRLVEGAIVEAVIRTHTKAPSFFIDGVKGEDGVDFETLVTDDNVMVITMKTDVVRIASVKASDSNIVVCDLIPEDSAEGRKQLNNFVRGVPDDPRVVLQKAWNADYRPILKYYTCSDSKDVKSVDLYYVPYPSIDETIVMVCPKLEYAVLNEVLAMVLDSLNEHEKAELYRNKVKENMEV